MHVKWIAGALLCASFWSAQAADTSYHAEFIETSKAWGSVVADFNNDGHDDIYITGHDEHDRIWYWTDLGYVPSSFEFLFVDRHDCDAADFNRDGLLDLFCTVGAVRGTGQGPNELWLQRANDRFEKVADHGAEDPYGRGRYPVFLDFNHDGYPDVYITNEATERTDGQVNINHLFINNAGKGFTEQVTRATGGLGFACVEKADINHDGWDDLAICHETGLPHLFINNREGDFDELSTEAAAVKARDVRFADMNGDGWVDLVHINGNNTVEVWLNTRKPPYFENAIFQKKLVFQGKWLTVGDFNHDGRPDIYVVQQKNGCVSTLQDVADDLLFEGQVGLAWKQTKQTQAYAGCGHQAETVDGNKVLLLNGGVSYRGPNYVIDWRR